MDGASPLGYWHEGEGAEKYRGNFKLPIVHVGKFTISVDFIEKGSLVVRDICSVSVHGMPGKNLEDTNQTPHVLPRKQQFDISKNQRADDHIISFCLGRLSEFG